MPTIITLLFTLLATASIIPRRDAKSRPDVPDLRAYRWVCRSALYHRDDDDGARTADGMWFYADCDGVRGLSDCVPIWVCDGDVDGDRGVGGEIGEGIRWLWAMGINQSQVYLDKN
ncbi:hypothetical protein M8818_004039 [Zalaria obscura]|uniref:Uncharacterized protein n=1 Tax=Zalaria obscura TaxID=2024903 RepID=A0ACC3SH27_9PEZI